MKTLFVITLAVAAYFGEVCDIDESSIMVVDLDEVHGSFEEALEALNSKYQSVKSMVRIRKTTEDLFNTFCDKFNMDMSDDEYYELFKNTFTSID